MGKKRKKNNVLTTALIILMLGFLAFESYSIIEVIKLNKIKTASSMGEAIIIENNIEMNDSVEVIKVKLDNLNENKNEIENIENQNTKNENIENEKNNENKENNNNNDNDTTYSNREQYYIKVNRQANVVTVYSRQSNGKYEPIRAMVCSTGYATPTGTYYIQGRWNWGGLFGDVYGQYCVHVVGNILFHSVPYTERGNKNSLEWWEYDKLGTTASMGCVRLPVEDIKWIYDNMPTGTPVEFYNSADPGPLGKPSAQKISGDTKLRGWDPTDPDPNNPWRKVVASTNTTNNKPSNNTNNTSSSNKPNNNTNTNSTTNTNSNTNTTTNTNTNTNTNNNSNTNTSSSTNTSNNNSNTNTNTSTNTNSSTNTSVINETENSVTNTDNSTNEVDNTNEIENTNTNNVAENNTIGGNENEIANNQN